MAKKGVFLILGFVAVACGGVLLAVAGNLFPTTGTFSADSRDAFLTIAYDRDIESLSPLDNGPEVLSRTLNMYEGLVILDRTLQPQPGIALTYGQLDDTHWEFRLRDNVLFHNGQKVTVEDVIHSFDVYRNQSNQDYSLETIATITAKDKQTLIIATSYPDALLLHKIARVFIFPAETSLDQLRTQPVGTGPYKLATWEKSKLLQFTRNDFYWGTVPPVRTVRMLTVTDPDEWKKLLDNRSVDIGVDIKNILDAPGYDPYIIPILYQNFLFFNLEQSFLSDVGHRKSIEEFLHSRKSAFLQKLSDPTYFPTEQFISSGTVGYNPNITKSQGKNDGDFDGQGATLSLSYDASMSREATWIQQSLQERHLQIELYPLTPQEFVQTVQAGTSDMFLFGWMFDFGDAGEFFDKVIHSKKSDAGYGMYNGMHYASADSDELIEESRHLTDPPQRLKNLQTLNDMITQQEIIGVPLFEVRRLFMVRQGVPFHPRLDGYLLFKDVQI